MKVLWIADFGLKHNIGGAQRTNHIVMSEGVRRGYEIIQFNYDSELSVFNTKYDVIVSNNLESLSRNPSILQYIVNHPNHFRFEHDSNSYLSPEAREALFSSTLCSFFLSQYHFDQFKELYGIHRYCKNYEVVVPPINTDKFSDQGMDRQDKTLYVGFLHWFKGTYNFLDYVLDNPQKEFVMAAWGPENLENTFKKFRNIEWLGKVDYENMPVLYNKYKTLYYHPEKFEPFCRTIGEAIFSGIDLNVNGKIGAVKEYEVYGTEVLRDRCKNSSSLFWDKINEFKT